MKQKKCFKNSSGIIFISNYAYQYIKKDIDFSTKNVALIHHGISKRFVKQLKAQDAISFYSFTKPFKFLYVSSIHVYKHQWNVIEAISRLRKKGIPVELHLVGSVIFKPSGEKLKNAMISEDPKGEFIFYHGELKYEEIETCYDMADGIIFASTCENMPNVLIESMASGIPIACSDKEPMPEFLGSGGYYFNSRSIVSIMNCLEIMLSDPEQREFLANQNLTSVEKYSWQKTSKETFQFILENQNFRKD